MVGVLRPSVTTSVARLHTDSDDGLHDSANHPRSEASRILLEIIGPLHASPSVVDPLYRHLPPVTYQERVPDLHTIHVTQQAALTRSCGSACTAFDGHDGSRLAQQGLRQVARGNGLDYRRRRAQCYERVPPGLRRRRRGPRGRHEPALISTGFDRGR